MAVKPRKRNYVNNPDFLAALVAYRAACEEAKAAGKQAPVVPNYIAECIMQMSKRLASKSNFAGYAFREDMIMDAVENCLQFLHSFDPEKSNNPFAYFTRIIWNAFLRRISKEKKHLYVQFKLSQDALSMADTYAGGEDVSISLSASPDYIDAFIEDYEAKMTAKK